ncbi:uncharacterized protein ACLA_083460 [Aspergillus clavatus NRRL 1]|uniref:Uncharacterized protein n=1 Tax=Aspergillus clavatus (strain ATCC 1007 / CBS 513.65 / DSM 816 / NCTC 3887 / NRRL 1 / QM 1276 / 107) TaxID=344612 RepID=A1CTL4_ASPCL|nr:uncharacterized protein ACLA_083460 [Aspergillus clavatus NRRL 1]EAW06651.1 conserved hypothetical protein [Aspergillus clavatus NRRL 1]
MSMLKGLASIAQFGYIAARNTQRIPFRAPITIATQTRSFRSLPSLRASEEKPKIHDRNTLDPQRSEGTKTGTDNEVASHPAAYDPNTTSPESEIAETEKETKQGGKVSNPLNVSAANQGVSEARDPQEGGPDHNADKSALSGKGRTRKGKEVHTGNK